MMHSRGSLYCSSAAIIQAPVKMFHSNFSSLYRYGIDIRFVANELVLLEGKFISFPAKMTESLQMLLIPLLEMDKRRQLIEGIFFIKFQTGTTFCSIFLLPRGCQSELFL